MALIVEAVPDAGGLLLLTYTPAEAGATVTAVRIYSDPARTALVDDGTPTQVSAGVWTFSADLPSGDYYTAWDVTGTGGSSTDAEGFLYVQRGQVVDGTTLVGVHQVRARLNKQSKTDDGEIADMIAAAVAEYRELVGPVGRTSVPYYGGPFPRYATDTVLTDNEGNVVPSDTAQGSPYLYWNEPLGIMGHGLATSYTLTYTVTLPANHREAILADVAGLFMATQRGNGVGARPDAGYDSGLLERSTPVVLFPRIRALAASLSTVA